MVKIFWVVEMFIPACSSLDLGSYLALYLCSPCQSMLIPVVWRIVIWVMGLGLRLIESDSSGLCPVNFEKHVVSHHTQI
jgi:hypothetical protein